VKSLRFASGPAGGKRAGASAVAGPFFFHRGRKNRRTEPLDKGSKGGGPAGPFPAHINTKNTFYPKYKMDPPGGPSHRLSCCILGKWRRVGVPLAGSKEPFPGLFKKTEGFPSISTWVLCFPGGCFSGERRLLGPFRLGSKSFSRGSGPGALPEYPPVGRFAEGPQGPTGPGEGERKRKEKKNGKKKKRIGEGRAGGPS